MTGDRIPRIIIAGVQKCGTTALHDTLCQHSMIEGASYVFPESSRHAPKELHFFDSEARRALGWTWYTSHFAANEKVKIEATPEYITSRATIAAMWERLPNAKIILILRDPLDRLISAWNHWCSLPKQHKWGVPSPGGTLFDNVAAELNDLMNGWSRWGLFERGLYYRAVETLREFYPPEQIRVLFLEDLIKDPAPHLQRLQEWLQLPPEPLRFYRANPGRSGVRAQLEMSLLRRSWVAYKHASAILHDILGISPPWAKTWRSWCAARPALASGAPRHASNEPWKVLAALRKWLMIARNGQIAVDKNRGGCAPQQKVERLRSVAAAFSRATPASALMTMKLQPDELSVAVRALLARGVKLTTNEVSWMLRSGGHSQSALLRTFVEHGYVEQVAQYWEQTR